jgi:flagellar biosynthesis protein FlhB
MENLRPDIFVIPVIALGLVIGLFFYFLKRVTERRIYKQYILKIAILAFVLNFIWEVAQGPLYKGYEYDWQHISFCALASVADMLMVLILLFLFGLIYNNVLDQTFQTFSGSYFNVSRWSGCNNR